jgi:uncharacterized protein involved in exopolysaccharide biosynthesis
MEETITVNDRKGFKNPYSFVLQSMYKKRRFIFLTMLVFLIFGIIYLSLAKKEYSASAMVLPQISASKGISKKYSKIASLVGINLGGGEEGTTILPTLYPYFIGNLYFQRALLSANVKNNKTQDSITYGDYISKYHDNGSIATIKSYTVGLPSRVINLFKSSPKSIQRALDKDINYISEAERSQIGVLLQHININFDELDGVIKIDVTTYDPLLSEQIVNRCKEILESAIINLSIEKAKNDSEFLKKRLAIAKEEYAAKRGALGRFKDSNKYSLTSYSKNIEEQLKAEYDLSYEIYSQISSQFESSKIQISKDTPIFTLIKPAVVPNESSSMSSLKVLIISLCLGFIIGVFIILFFAFKPFIFEYLKTEISAE